MIRKLTRSRMGFGALSLIEARLNTFETRGMLSPS
jgi:hypothetical protein